MSPEAAPAKPAVNEKLDSVLKALGQLTDDDLREVVKRCGENLGARDKQRREDAVKEIHKIAKEFGLSVDVKGRPAKRRKTTKAAGQAAPKR
jgi:hypothetical protein